MPAVTLDFTTDSAWSSPTDLGNGKPMQHTCSPWGLQLDQFRQFVTVCVFGVIRFRSRDRRLENPCWQSRSPIRTHDSRFVAGIYRRKSHRPCCEARTSRYGTRRAVRIVRVRGEGFTPSVQVTHKLSENEYAKLVTRTSMLGKLPIVCGRILRSIDTNVAI